MKFFSLLSQHTVHKTTDDKIIPQEEFTTLMSAQDILDRARKEKLAFQKEIEQEAMSLFEESEKKGFQEGLTRFNTHLLQFEQELKKIRHEMNASILPLALKAAKKIVGKELELHPETIVDIVLQALAPVTQNRRIKIWVNKEDKDLLENEKTRIREILEQVEVLLIQERADVTKGGCVIETESGIINATIENQWHALEVAFEKYKKQTQRSTEGQ